MAILVECCMVFANMQWLFLSGERIVAQWPLVFFLVFFVCLLLFFCLFVFCLFVVVFCCCFFSEKIKLGISCELFA